MDDQTLKNYIDDIEDHLKTAAVIAQQMQAYVQAAEGDSDLYRKLAFYLVPNTVHWLEGRQAGGVVDLRETLGRRLAGPAIDPVQSGNTSKVLTKKK
jgi:hypothetical protein